MDDPAIWKLLPNDERIPWTKNCALFEADAAALQFPSLAWETCGQGCNRADVVQGFSTSGYNVSVGVEHVAGRLAPYLLAKHAVYSAADGSLGVIRILDLSSGETVAATSVRSGGAGDCAQILNTDSIFSFGHIWFQGYEEKSKKFRFEGAWNPRSRSWIWRQPWIDLADEPFKAYVCEEFIMPEGGRYFYACGNGTLWASLEPGSSEASILHDATASDYGVLHGSALGDLAIWSEMSGDHDDLHSRIRGWKSDDLGVRTLVNRIPGAVCEVALSDKQVAGYLASSCGMYGLGHRLVVAPLNDDGTVGEFRTSPPLTDTSVTVGEIRTAGDFIAVRAHARYFETRTEKSPVYLIRTTDWAVRMIDYLPESQAKSIALTDEHLYVVHGANRANPDLHGTSHVYRYDLSRFDELGTLIVPTTSEGTDP